MEFTTLIPVEELAEQIENPAWVVIDCRFALGNAEAGIEQYCVSHLPGARYAHLDKDLSSPVTPASGRHPLPNAHDFCLKLGEWGVSNDSQVIAYDDAGGAFAARLWWLLRWAGHRNVAVLNGGFSAWADAGLPLTEELPEISPTVYECISDDSVWLSTNKVAEGLAANAITLVDAREAERFRGEAESIDPVAGHVPGALNLPFKENLDSRAGFLPRDALRARFADMLGDSSPSEVVHMCGSGVTACHNLLAMESAGLHGSRLYAGSWSEWIRDAKRPVATGA